MYFTYKQTDTTKFQSGLTPIRTNVAVSDLDEAMEWWASNMPSVAYNYGRDPYNYTYSDNGNCRWNSFKLMYYEQTMLHEIRFVENPKAMKSTYSLDDFITYIEDTNSEYAGPNWGWSAWYDRHSGIDIDTSGCSLDTYMFALNDTNTGFMPHGRNGTDSIGQPTNHVWTSGNQGWGLELQGSYKYQFADCYSDFDWCSATTCGTAATGWHCRDGKTWSGR